MKIKFQSQVSFYQMVQNKSQKSSSQPTHIALKINGCPENTWYAVWGFCSPQQQNLVPKISGKINNLFCLLLSTQNKTWLEGREEVVILQAMVKSSRVVLFDGEKQFSRQPLEIKKQTTRCGTLGKLIILVNLCQLAVPIRMKVLQVFFLSFFFFAD